MIRERILRSQRFSSYLLRVSLSLPRNVNAPARQQSNQEYHPSHKVEKIISKFQPCHVIPVKFVSGINGVGFPEPLAQDVQGFKKVTSRQVPGIIYH